MNNDQLNSITSFEAACDAFETRRKRGSMTSNELTSFTFGFEDESRHQLLLELIKLDLFYRWREAKNGGSYLVELAPYLSYFEAPITDELVVDLIRTDYVCQYDAGCLRSSEEYVAEFPNLESVIRSKIAELVCDLDTICIQVIDAGLLRFQTYMAGTTIFGRQKKGEPEPFELVPLPDDRHKFVMAPGEDARFSREQALVVPTSCTTFEIQSLSSKCDTICNGTRVLPNEPMLADLPLDLVIGSQLIRLTK